MGVHRISLFRENREKVVHSLTVVLNDEYLNIKFDHFHGLSSIYGIEVNVTQSQNTASTSGFSQTGSRL